MLRSTTSKTLAASTACLLAGYSIYRYNRRHTAHSSTIGETPVKTPSKMTVNHTFQTLFAVPLSCDVCVKSVSDALYSLGGITKVEGDLENQLIAVEGSAAPSKIVEAIQDTGRDAILRGSGSSNSAAVSILESFAESVQQESDEDPSREVRGLARMVEVGSGRTLVDLTVRGVSPGTYRATIRQYGDLKHGAASTGPVWKQQQEEESQPKGLLGIVEVGKDGRGSVFVDRDFYIWEVIGHAMVLTKQQDDGPQLKNDADTVVGVIARSSGMWDNDKTVCSCTGKTLWEERKDEVAKGML
ncbi:hypothetical protein LMH87_010807 [Akanthomyces muscarius]|uniref:Superoxide dismutase 1 copper chaperone n=1 Tax=Akanthomyces muscarius TaxID=2231603 RepID=A0A9W8Q8I0_AKAMU|nr:hypothetical protein LMH87_010807 [Akanthomyces muscarius]KAJ4150040.1 hypothetical protein LMH87_010807 [Akanthomyces muscarius]